MRIMQAALGAAIGLWAGTAVAATPITGTGGFFGSGSFVETVVYLPKGDYQLTVLFDETLLSGMSATVIGDASQFYHIEPDGPDWLQLDRLIYGVGLGDLNTPLDIDQPNFPLPLIDFQPLDNGFRMQVHSNGPCYPRAGRDKCYQVDYFEFVSIRGTPTTDAPIPLIWTISDIPTGAVPEPATWAMMILGFGAVGSMLRRARRRPAGVGLA